MIAIPQDELDLRYGEFIMAIENTRVKYFPYMAKHAVNPSDSLLNRDQDELMLKECRD